MKKIIISISVLAIFACQKFGSDLNKGKDGCVDCVLIFDSIKGSDTMITHYKLTYPTWNFQTNRTDWCHYLNEMNGKTQTIDTILIKQTVSCK